MSCSTFAASPTYAIVNGRRAGRGEWSGIVPAGELNAAACSCKVRRSARIWVGCHKDERAFSTGTGEYFASS